MQWIVYYTLIAILIVSLLAYLFLIILYNSKLKLLELRIKKLFEQRTDLIPSLFQVTKSYIDKHDMVFWDIVYLKKIEMFNATSYDLPEFLALEAKIHHELNFIFKVLKPIKKIEKDWKFLYIRDLIDNVSADIWKQIRIYKIVSGRYNTMRKYKNFTIIWMFIPLPEKTEI